jgi:hypothetical protein
LVLKEIANRIRGISLRSAWATAFFLFLLVGVSYGQSAAGRWQVSTTTGDQPAQVKSGVSVVFDTTFVCFNGACGALDIYTRDTSICDQVNYANVSSGMLANAGLNESGFEFAVAGGSGGAFIYEFVGTLVETSTETNGVLSVTAAKITGQYGSTPGGCNNGIANAQGSFVADWYPALTGVLLGELRPTERAATSIGMELKLTQSQNGNLSGEVVTGTLVTNPRSGVSFIQPAKSPCFTSSTLQIIPGPVLFPSAAAGHLFHLYATDPAGNSVALEAQATSIGSNEQYSVGYEITGGPCNGQNGTNFTFRLPMPTRRIVVPRPRDPRLEDTQN